MKTKGGAHRGETRIYWPKALPAATAACGGIGSSELFVPCQLAGNPCATIVVIPPAAVKECFVWTASILSAAPSLTAS